MFVALEGVDGTGKTTVAQIIRERHPGCINLRTPGHCFRQVRDLVLNPEYNLDDNARLMFFLGEMVDLGKRVVEPARASALILTDRFYLSTFVYQVLMREDTLSSAELGAFAQLFELFLPQIDVTVILTVDVETAQKRSRGHDVEFSGADYFEAADTSAWKRRKSYYDTAKNSLIAKKLGKVVYIDTAYLSPEEVADQIEALLT